MNNLPVKTPACATWRNCSGQLGPFGQTHIYTSVTGHFVSKFSSDFLFPEAMNTPWWTALVVLATTTITILDQTVAQQPPVYTFKRADGGESWIRYQPTWPSGSDQPRFEFSFRSKRANSFVFSMSFAREETNTHEVTLWGTLKKGELHVTLKAAEQEVAVKAGKGWCLRSPSAQNTQVLLHLIYSPSPTLAACAHEMNLILILQFICC